MPSTSEEAVAFCVYVIRLRTEALKKRRIADANPGHLPYKPCVYVGSTSLTPEERYAKHLDPASKVGSRIVREYHIRLHDRLTKKQPTFATRKEAEEHERRLAERLREKGYAVWSK
jgi:hypothetical protein